VLTVVSLPATTTVRPDTLSNYKSYPLAFAVPLVVVLSIVGIFHFSRREADRKAFTCSCAYLAVMLVGAAIGLYPRLLPSSSDPTRDITVEKALSGSHTLQVGLAWWAFGMLLALTYFVIVYRLFRGKVSLEAGGYGH
jgi:cytochrome bd ubiquinol oxidase subunit II